MALSKARGMPALATAIDFATSASACLHRESYCFRLRHWSVRYRLGRFCEPVGGFPDAFAGGDSLCAESEYGTGSE